MASQMFHLGFFLGGFRVPAWNQPWSGTSSRDWSDGMFYVDLARAFERACFDYFMIEDSNYIPDDYGDSMEVYLKLGHRAPKHDPAVLAAQISQYTKSLGIVATLATSETTPFHLARLISSLDHLSHGRIGWNMVTGSSDHAAQNFGHKGQLPHDERYDVADEFVRLVTKLWGSWDQDAVILDEKSGYYIDHTKVRVLDYHGKYFASRGPSVALPPVQGRPVLCQAGVSPRGLKFTARHSDTVIATANGPDGMKAVRDQIRTHAVEAGRDPNSIKVMFLVRPIIGETEQDAQHRARMDAADRKRQLEMSLSNLASNTMLDFSKFDLDEPLPKDVTTNGHSGMLVNMVNSGKTLRQIGEDSVGMPLVGTPGSLAAQMDEAMQHIGGDGFLLTHMWPTRRYVDEICDGLVPALQARGLVRTAYEFPTFRENLHAF
jgi:FMN-dependent oxidoreductase (nitrilotriacetate monooxygenase family)